MLPSQTGLLLVCAAAEGVWLTVTVVVPADELVQPSAVAVTE